MCSAQILLDAVTQLPDDVSLQKIAEKIEFLVAIDQLDRGERIPQESEAPTRHMACKLT